MYPEIMKSMLHEMKMSTRLLKLCKAWGENINARNSVKILDAPENKLFSNKINHREVKEKAILKKVENEPYLNKFVSNLLNNL